MVDLSFDGMELASAGFVAPRKPRPYQSAAETFFARAVFAAEQLQRQGSVVNADTVIAESGLPRRKVEELVASSAWMAALEERGISGGFEPLTPRQMASLAIYMDMTVARTHAQKLQAAGVRQAEWAGWLRQPRFSQYLSDLSSEALQGSLPVARQRIAEHVDAGDLKAIELMLKLTGNDPDQNVDLQKVLMGIFQILDEEIADAGVMARIGAKVQHMVGGGQGQELQRQVVQLRPSEPRVYPGPAEPPSAFPIQES